MAVYVDDMRAPHGRMIMCHMAADSRAELLAMADRIGVDRRWLQKEGTWMEHFDICLSKRALAVSHGAREVTRRALVEGMRARHAARNRPAGRVALRGSGTAGTAVLVPADEACESHEVAGPSVRKS